MGNLTDTQPGGPGLPHSLLPEVMVLNPGGHCWLGCVMSKYATLIQPPRTPQPSLSMSQYCCALFPIGFLIQYKPLVLFGSSCLISLQEHAGLQVVPRSAYFDSVEKYNTWFYLIANVGTYICTYILTRILQSIKYNMYVLKLVG